MFTTHARRARLLALAAGSALALAAAGATAIADEEPKPATDEPAEVLRGPEVEDRDVPGSDSTFGDPEMKPMRDKERPLPHRAFMAALRGLGGEDAPPELRATEAQRDEVREIEREFLDARRAYMQKHRDEIRELMAQLRPEGAGPPARRGAAPDDPERGEPMEETRPREGRRGRPARADAPRGPREGGRPRINPEDLTEEQRVAFDRLREIRGAGPQASAYHARIWEVLTPEQRAFVEGRIEEIRERGAEQWQRGRAGDRPARDRSRDGRRPSRDRQPEEGRGLGPGPRVGAFAGRGLGANRGFGQGPGPGFGSDATGGPRMEALMRRIDRLPPELRERVLDRLDMFLEGVDAAAQPRP